MPEYGYHYDEDEIDLLELAKTIWNKRMFIIKVVALGAVVGVLAALLSPKEYKSTATLMPEYSTEVGAPAAYCANMEAY